MAYAVVSPRLNSHPFQERKIRFNLQEPVKVGRSVAKAKPSSNNLIFDCKVLSRNHAVIWYEKGKFFLQDTKSSNGTYINNVRLSVGGEESKPVEVKSGSALQFGVDVVENSKKVTHGCIYASITLFHPDGREALGSTDETGIASLLEQHEVERKVSPTEIWQLSQYLLEALHREQMLELKLATLQRMIGNGETAADDTWQGFIHEDKLLSRLDILENQLEVFNKDLSEDEVKGEMIKSHNDKQSYETAAKETIRKTLQEKIYAVQKLADIERLLSNSEDEYSHLKTLYDRTQEELKDLMEKHRTCLEQMNELQDKVTEAEERHQALNSKAKEEKDSLKNQLEDAEKRGSTLAVKVESLEVECDITRKQLDAMRTKLEKYQGDDLEGDDTPELDSYDESDEENTDTSNDKPTSLALPNGPVSAGTGSNDMSPEENTHQAASDITVCKMEVEEVTEFEGVLDTKTHTDSHEIFDKPSPTGSDIVALEKELQEKCELIDVLEAQLDDSHHELVEAKSKITKLTEQIESIQKEQTEKVPRVKESLDSGLGTAQSHPEVVEQRVSCSFDIKRDSNGLLHEQTSDASDLLAKQFEVITEIQDNLLDIKEAISFAFLPSTSLQAEDAIDSGKTPEPGHNGFSNLHLPCAGSLEEQVDLHGKALASCSLDIRNLKDLLHKPLETVTVPDKIASRDKIIKTQDGKSSETMETTIVANCDYEHLQDELDLTQSEMRTFKKQIEQLRDQLLEEQRVSRSYQELVAGLESRLSETKKQLELEMVDKEYEHKALESARSVAMEMQKKVAEKSEIAGKEKVELSGLKDENQSLKLKIQLLDAEIKKLRHDHTLVCSEKARIAEDFTELKTRSVKHLELCKEEKAQLQEQIEFQKKCKGISSAEVSALEERFEETRHELLETRNRHSLSISNFNQQKSQLIQLVLAMFILIVAFGAAFMLDIINITPGSSPIYDRTTWTSLWDNIFW